MKKPRLFKLHFNTGEPFELLVSAYDEEEARMKGSDAAEEFHEIYYLEWTVTEIEGGVYLI